MSETDSYIENFETICRALMSHPSCFKFHLPLLVSLPGAGCQAHYSANLRILRSLNRNHSLKVLDSQEINRAGSTFFRQTFIGVIFWPSLEGVNVRSVPSIRNKGSRLVPKSFRMGMEKLHSAVRDEILPVQCSYCEFDAHPDC
jgi:hypothetical protein